VEATENRRAKDRGELLCLKGTAYSFKGDSEQALASYEHALNIYREIYGSDHNRHSALAIGNLGRVYVNAGEEEKARECLQVAMNIVGELAGRQDADYLHFEGVHKNLRQYLP
jgi:tetratricopeptide (TPR) repeat protein